MTTPEYATHPDFLAACRFWQENGAAPYPFADWFDEHDLPAHGAGWRWAATGYDGMSEGVRPKPAGDIWIWSGLPVFYDPMSVGKFEGSDFPAAIVRLLEAWAGAGLSVEQLEATRALLTSPEQVRTLGGYAGTGKTRVLQHLHHARPTYAVCAFTGKAADVMKRRGITSAQTIHMTIYRPVRENGRRVRWEKKSKRELGCDGFLVDEASMVSADIHRDMLAYGLPVIAVGDHGQLPPVGEDAGLMRDPLVRLETVHRNAGPVAKFAEHLRLGGDAREWNDAAKTIEEFVAAPVVKVMPGQRLPDSSLLAADQIICAYNRTRVGLNRKVRELRGATVHTEPDEMGKWPQVGDRVMCLRNDGAAGVFNGMQGAVVALGHEAGLPWMAFRPAGSDQTLIVGYEPAAFHRLTKPKEEKRRVPGRDIPFDFAYCVTAHKAQGDEWDKVVVFEEDPTDLWEQARWNYTAASRAKEKLIWVTEIAGN